MSFIKWFAFYWLLIVSVIISVLVICLSKTMSIEQLSLRRFFVKSTETSSIKVTKKNEDEGGNEDEHLPYNILAFSQDPLEGEQRYREAKQNLDPYLMKNKGDCEKLYVTYLDECIGMWSKRSDKDCQLLDDNLVERCLIPEEENDI